MNRDATTEDAEDKDAYFNGGWWEFPPSAHTVDIQNPENQNNGGDNKMSTPTNRELRVKSNNRNHALQDIEPGFRDIAIATNGAEATIGDIETALEDYEDREEALREAFGRTLDHDTETYEFVANFLDYASDKIEEDITEPLQDLVDDYAGSDYNDVPFQDVVRTLNHGEAITDNWNDDPSDYF